MYPISDVSQYEGYAPATAVFRLPTLRSAFSSVRPNRADQNPPKDSLLDRNKINTESREYSESRSDDAASDEASAAYEPTKTDPESMMEEAGKKVRFLQHFYLIELAEGPTSIP